MSWFTSILLILLAATADEAETPIVDEAGDFTPLAPATEIVVRQPGLEGAWLEITHLGSDLPPVLVSIEPRRDEGELIAFVPDLPPGPTLVCGGARTFGVRCEEVFRGADEFIGPAEVEVEFVPGLEIRGTLRQDLEPVAGARVALAPADLEAFRPFTMPLDLEGDRVVREVESDADGAFVVPEIAPGEYFLETVLPSGRVHRTEPFDLPDRDALRRNFEVDDRLADTEDLFWDVGRIDVPTGLDVAFLVLDPAGQPISGAAVAAAQGSTPFDVTTFESTSDAEGRASLHGLDVEKPVRLNCEKEGFEPFTEEYELLPVEVDCVLRPWATVTGELIGPDSLPPRGAAVTLRPAEGGGEPLSVAVTADGVFGFFSVPAASYELRAAAPGFRVEERSFAVDAGEILDLGPIAMLSGREIEGRVVDRETGEPLPGVDLRSLSPPGAVQAFTDVDGEFRFAVDAGEPLVLEASTVDYAAREITLSLEDLRSREPLVLELEPAGWILAVVEAAAGVPCRGCRVVVWPGGEEMWTDGDGEALSGPLAAGTYQVSRPRITHLGSTVVEQPEAAMLRVRVEPGRLTTARLTAPGPALRVRFRPDLDGAWTLSARQGRRTEKSFAEDDGRFPVHRQGGEPLDLSLNTYDTAAGREITIWQTTLAGGFFSDEVTIELSGSVVRGRLAGPAGPLAGAEVRLVSFADAATRAVVYAYADGTFRVPHVRPGVYSLYVGPRSVKFVVVSERQTVDLGTFEIFLDPYPAAAR